MILLFLFLFCLITNIIANNNPICKTFNANDLVLNTLYGRIKGKCYDITVNYALKRPDTKRVITWLSVPYAEPPVKDLRFKPSKLIQSKWQHILDGTKMPNKCIQSFINSKSTHKTSEDCLYLNIFVPYERNKMLLPILVWFHSEENFNQGSNLDIDPVTLVAISNIIVITVNYRLGAFGFLHIKNTPASGNQAIYDQYLALKWIFENSFSFGGDSRLISIGGDSSGSLSVGIHLIYKPSWSLFNNAILLTTGGHNSDLLSSDLLSTSNEATNLAYATGAFLGCLTNLTTIGMFNCLLYSDVNSLNNISSYFYTKPNFLLDFNIFSQQPRILFNNGNFKKCSILTGFHYSIRLKDSSVNQDLCSTSYQLADLYSRHNLNAFVYSYRYGDELKLFLAKPLSTIKESAQDRLLSEKLVEYLRNFLKYYDPNSNDNLKWFKFRNILTINGYSIKNDWIFDVKNPKCF